MKNETAHRDAAWRTSTYSDEGTGCVAVAPLDIGIGVRDSKLPDSPVHVFPAIVWTRFLKDTLA